MLKKQNLILLIFGSLLLNVACKSNSAIGNGQKMAGNSLIVERCQKLLEYPVDSLSFPRSMSVDDGAIRKVDSGDWTSGFFPGNLWMLYELTGDRKYRKKATEWTSFVTKERHNIGTHDIGFMIYCSLGTGFNVSGKKEYRELILDAAKTLSKRFDNNVGCTRSWDFGKNQWEFPVIIDNMMNLELLFEATKISGDSIYHQMAVQHANTTMENHFRSDNSTYHLVDYNPINGKVNKKMTHQGFSDESAWARGQAWAIYGYTMAHRYTRNSAYLAQAEATAKYYLQHTNLPKDGIPYWDFDAPQIPNAPRDVSASTIVASALFELYSFTGKEQYLNYSKKVLKTLRLEKYILDRYVSGPFILGNSTGHWPAQDEISQPIIYADYYFLEAILREKTMTNK